jgi:tryptophanase
MHRLSEHSCTSSAYPFMLPIGGRAANIDEKELYPHIFADQYPGQALE